MEDRVTLFSDFTFIRRGTSDVFEMAPRDYKNAICAEFGLRWDTTEVTQATDFRHLDMKPPLVSSPSHIGWYNEADITSNGYGFTVTFDPPTIKRNYSLDNPGETYNPLPEEMR